MAVKFARSSTSTGHNVHWNKDEIPREILKVVDQQADTRWLPKSCPGYLQPSSNINQSTINPSPPPSGLLLADYLKSIAALCTRLSDNPQLISSPSTTASYNQPCLPLPSHQTGFTPQPDFCDFSLFAPQHQSQAPATARQSAHRVQSLDSNQLPTYKTHPYTGDRTLSAHLTGSALHRRQPRNSIPPVPLFHSNSTGHLQQQKTENIFDNTVEMGGGKFPFAIKKSRTFLMQTSDINVAYDGTAADLVGVEAALFDAFAFNSEYNSSTDSLPFGNQFTSINNTDTVSPKDIFNDAPLSMPPSAAFTNLTTPGSAMIDTPDDSYETSPLFTDNLDQNTSHMDEWFSLFPEEEKVAPAMTRTVSTGSNPVVVHPGGESRKRASVTASPMTLSARASSTVGIHKREKVLPPIVVDENDVVALKRARNTAAARKSRDKKVKERDGLEARIRELEAEVEHWKALALQAKS
ncbi:hypothetical protein MBLNU457_5469t2 [Dothideomycetes sp. NU457]